MLLSISRTSTGNNFYFCSICNITFILLKVKVWNIISYFFHIRACLKNHSRNLHAPLCGIFCLNSVAVARYGAFIRTKSPTNCDAHLAESLFQTRSKMPRMISKLDFLYTSLTTSGRSVYFFKIKRRKKYVQYILPCDA